MEKGIQAEYGNEWERTVLGRDDEINPAKYAREIARYTWAATHISDGMSVAEIGCSSGFGTRFLPKDIDYLGIDYDQKIIGFAREQFGDATHRFERKDIESFIKNNRKKYDVIIAFEVLEHVPNGKELAQELKKHCSTLLATVPYRESVGFWGKHHVLHGLTEKDFPGFKYRYMRMDGQMFGRPNPDVATLMLMEWKEGVTYPKRYSVLCCIPTKNRYDGLMQTLQSVAFQTTPPDTVAIYDDGAGEDIRKHPIGRYILPLLTSKGIQWEVKFTPKKGQHIAHELANRSGYDLVWRLDDDTIAEPDVLERLLAYMGDDVGAVGGSVYELERKIYGGTSKIEDFYNGVNVQWAPDQGIHDVDFLYSSFLYRAGIVHYKEEMSPAAFHEETIFTHRMKRAGYRLIADTSIHTYHFKSPHGGTRDTDLQWGYRWDADEFTKIMEHEFRVKLIHNSGGIGDNYALKHLLPELRKKYDTIIIGTVYPHVYHGEVGVKTIRVDESEKYTKENVYQWMLENHWNGSIVDAYKQMYL